MITVNTYPIVLLTNRVVPSMLLRKERSLIINLSSVSACRGFPYL